MIPSSWNFLLKAVSRIVLLPVIAGVSYEILKLSANGKIIFLVELLYFLVLAFRKLLQKSQILHK